MTAQYYYGEQPDHELLKQIGDNLSGGVVGCRWEDGFPFFYISDQFLDFTGYSYEEFVALTGGSILAAMHPGDRARVAETVEEQLGEQGRYQIEYRIRRRDGGWAWLRGTGKRALDREGRESIVSVSTNVTEAVELRQALERKRSELQTLMDRIPCGLCKVRLDEDLTLEYANDFFRELFGYGEDEKKIGSGRAFIYPEDWPAFAARVRRAVATGETRFESEHRFIHKSGALRWLLARFSWGEDEAELLHAAVLDITRRKEMEEQVRLSEEEYRLAVKHTGNTIDTYDVVTRTLTQPQSEADWFGAPATIAGMPEAARQYGVVVDSSWEDYAAFFNSMNDGTRKGEMTVLVNTASGDRHWLHARFTMIYAESGAPLRAVISYENVTERREKELAYQKWSQYFEGELEDTLGYYEFNLTTNAYSRSENTALSQIPESIRTLTGTVNYIAEHFICDEDRAAYRRTLDRKNLLVQFYEGDREVRFEHRRRDMAGKIYWALNVISLLQDPYSSDVKAFVLVKDVDEEKRQALLLQHLSERDTLTGLYNRRILVDRISQRLECGGDDVRHGIIMMDIDHFKQFNDSYGHHFGDRVLRDVADRLRQQLREGDFCGRLGGDEFMAFLDNVQGAGAMDGRLEAIAKALTIEYEEAGTVTVSMGLAFYPEDGTDFDTLYPAADTALYMAKRSACCRYAVYHRESDVGE